MSSSPGTAARTTWADYVRLPEDDRRELVDGALVEGEVPTELHEYVVLMLGAALAAWTRANGGRALASGYKVRIAEDRAVMPDLQLYRKGRPPGGAQGLDSGAPDLVVEVVSPGSQRHDRVTKLRWYAEIGAPEYWIVDPEARTLEQLVLEGDRYQVAAAVEGEETFEPETFPGLAVSLAELFTLPE